MSLLFVWERQLAKEKSMLCRPFNSDIYARILQPFTFPRSMRQYAHERQCPENDKQGTVSQENEAILRKKYKRA